MEPTLLHSLPGWWQAKQRPPLGLWSLDWLVPRPSSPERCPALGHRLSHLLSNGRAPWGSSSMAAGSWMQPLPAPLSLTHLKALPPHPHHRGTQAHALLPSQFLQGPCPASCSPQLQGPPPHGSSPTTISLAPASRSPPPGHRMCSKEQANLSLGCWGGLQNAGSHRCASLSQLPLTNLTITSLAPYGSGGQKSKMGLRGPKSRGYQPAFLLEAAGESVSISVPASRGHSCPLAHRPFLPWSHQYYTSCPSDLCFQGHFSC